MFAKPKDDIFIYIAGRPVSMKDIGAAADGPIVDALQMIVDKGLAGDWPAGTPWYHVFEPNCFKTGGAPPPEEELLSVLYQNFKDYEKTCRELSTKDELTQDHRDELHNRYKAYQAASKLSEA